MMKKAYIGIVQERKLMSLIFSFDLRVLHANHFLMGSKRSWCSQPLLPCWNSNTVTAWETYPTSIVAYLTLPPSRSSGDEPISAPRAAWKALFIVNLITLNTNT